MDQPFMFLKFYFQDFKIGRRHILELSCHTLCPGWLLCLSSCLVVLFHGFLGSQMRRSTNMWRKRGGQRPGENLGRIQYRNPCFDQGGQTGGLRSWEMSKDDGHLSRRRTLLRSVQFFIFYSLILAVTGDCGDDGCLCTIKIACKEQNDKEPENQVSPDSK